jgi:CHASE1-domain containing sensor protein
VVRLGFIIGFIALIGVLLSGLAAYRVHDQELAIDGIALSRAIDVHASLVQDRLTERELLARVASGLFRAPSVVKANMLQPLRSAIYAFKTDFVIASWIARLKPADLAAAQAELKSAGFTNPTIRDFDDPPLGHQGDRQADRRRWIDRAVRSLGLPVVPTTGIRDRADAGAGT